MKNQVLKLMVLITLMITVQIIAGCQVVKPIRIGFVSGLSGANSEVGVASRNAVELLVEQVNGKGGINGRLLELLIRDDENNLDRVRQVDQELIDAGVIAIIGHDMSYKAPVALETIGEQSVIMISPTISDDALSGKKDQFFRTIPKSIEQGIALAKQAMDRDGMKTPAIVYDAKNMPYADGVKRGFEDTAGVKLKQYEVLEDVTDAVGPIIEDGLKGDFDALVMVLNSKDAAFIAQKLYIAKCNVVLYSSNWAMTDDVIAFSGAAIEGVRFVSMVDLESQYGPFLSFKQAYEAKYKKAPNFAAINAYEAGELLVQALQESNRANALTIQAYLNDNRDYDTIQGEIELDVYGDRIGNAWIYTVEAGRFIKLK